MHPDLIQTTPRKRVFLIVSALVFAGLLTLKILEANPTQKPELKAEVTMPVVEMLAQESPAVQMPPPTPLSTPAPLVPPASPKVARVEKPEKTDQVAKKRTEPLPTNAQKPTKDTKAKVAAMKSTAAPAVNPAENSPSAPKVSPAPQKADPTDTEGKAKSAEELPTPTKVVNEPNEQAERDRLKGLMRNPSRVVHSPEGIASNIYKDAFEQEVSARLHGRLGNVKSRLAVTAQFDESGRVSNVVVEESNKPNSPIAIAAASYLKNLKIQRVSSNPVPSSMRIEMIVEGRE